MTSRSVEISIAGGGGEMVRVLSLGRNQSKYNDDSQVRSHVRAYESNDIIA